MGLSSTVAFREQRNHLRIQETGTMDPSCSATEADDLADAGDPVTVLTERSGLTFRPRPLMGPGPDVGPATGVMLTPGASRPARQWLCDRIQALSATNLPGCDSSLSRERFAVVFG
jgi:hypothetical protein